jgi:hypothetical protein
MKSILGLILAPFHGVAALAGSFAKASFGMRLAVVTALFLTVVFVLATAALLFAGEWALLQLWWSPTKIIAFLLLLVLAPLLVYQTVRLWSDPHVTRWPDIAQAWVAIGRDLERQGIRIAETPLFLVFGAAGPDKQAALFAEMSPRPLLAGSPGSGGPLHAYASADALYLVVDDIGRACGVARGAVDRQEGALSRTVATQARREATDRLAALCRIIARERQPVVAVNGVLICVPLDLTGSPQAGAAEETQFGYAIAADLRTLVREFGLRMPVTFVGLGVENDPATEAFFAILAGRQKPRVNADKTVSQPTGREDARGTAFPPGLVPSKELLVAVAANAVGPLVDEIGEVLLDLTRTADAASNRRLLTLLLRLRLRGAEQLREVLEQVFLSATDAEDTPLLAGCYVAALSADTKRTGFVSGVLDRVAEHQADLQWTSARRQADNRALSVAYVLFGLSLSCVLAACLLIWRGVTP